MDPRGDVPRAIRHQHWSVVFVPLMWAAACGDRECPVLQWLGRAAACGPPIIVGGIEMPAEDAVFVGWDALREAMSSGHQSREDLSEWIHNQGFVQPRWGAHFCARAQERILHGAVTRDVRCTAVESACVQITLQACQGLHPESSNQVFAVDDGVCTQTTPVIPSSPTPWQMLDDIDVVPHTFQRVAELSSTFEREVPPSHPHSSRGTPSSSIGGGCNRRFALGSCSVCCRSGCCAALTVGDVWAKLN